MDWKSDLNKTRPITLLETIRKALVCLVNTCLSQIMIQHSILRDGNHTGLPGSDAVLSRDGTWDGTGRDSLGHVSNFLCPGHIWDIFYLNFKRQYLCIQ